MNALRDWLNTQLGSDGGRAVQMILALIVVVVLLVALAWLFRRFSGSTHFGGRGHRLSVVDAAPVDGRRRLLLVRRDDVEHLVMIGGPNDLLVESRILRGPPTVAARPAGPVVTSVPTAVPAPSEEETRARSLPGAAALASAVASAGAFVRSRMNRSPAEPEGHRPIESPIDDDTLFDAPLGRAETAPPPPPPRPKPIGEPVGAAPVAAPQPPRGPRPPQNAQDAPLRQAPRPGAPQDGAPRAGAEPAVPPQPPIRPRPPAPPQAADDGAAPKPVPAPVGAKPVQRAATEVVPAPVPPAPRPAPKPEPVVVIAPLIPPMVAAAAVDVVTAPKPVPPPAPMPAPAPMPMPAPVPPPLTPAPSSAAARMEHADIAGEIERALSNLAAGPAPEPTQLEVDLLSELDLVVAASADRPKAVETAVAQEAPPAPKPEPATERIEPRFAEPAPHDEPAAAAPPVAPPPVEAPHAPLDELEEEMARLLAEISGQQRR